MSTATDWIMERLEIGPAYHFPIMLGVARACGMWNDAEECYTVEEATVRAATDTALSELVAAGRVSTSDDGRGQGATYTKAAESFVDTSVERVASATTRPSTCS